MISLYLSKSLSKRGRAHFFLLALTHSSHTHYPLSIGPTHPSSVKGTDRQTHSHIYGRWMALMLPCLSRRNIATSYFKIVYIVDQSIHKGVSYNTSSTHTAQPVNLDTIASWQKRKEC
ncbi:hypothetical protein F5H01DRAFT_328986 [Linnemannia elongata]|nr:hypothetical protein F5H01DRAFT_328986 [Linnemannia elongata]